MVCWQPHASFLMCNLNASIIATMVHSRAQGLCPSTLDCSSPAWNICRYNWVSLEWDIGWLVCSHKCGAWWGPFKTGIHIWRMRFPFVTYMTLIKMYLVSLDALVHASFSTSCITYFVLEQICKTYKVLKNSFFSPWEGTGGLNLPGKLIRDSVKKPRRSEWTPQS